MTLSEVLQDLQRAGIEVSRSTVDYLVRTGAISPVPFDGAHNRTFSEQHVAELCIILRSPRHRGRPARQNRAGLPVVLSTPGPIA